MVTMGAGVGLAVQLVSLGVGYVLLVPLALDESLRASARAPTSSSTSSSWRSWVTMIGNVGGATTLLALGASHTTVLGSIGRRSATVIGALTLLVSAVGLVSLDVLSVATLAFLPFEVWVLASSLSIVRHHGPAVS
jgi:hypothetical protein